MATNDKRYKSMGRSGSYENNYDVSNPMSNTGQRPEDKPKDKVEQYRGNQR